MATVTVIDDGRTATLHAFVDCGFVTTTDQQGTPYHFGLHGFYDFGTGVECTNQNGGYLLFGVLASLRKNGLYDIVGTQILLADHGRIARNDTSPEVLAEHLPPDDPQVALAMKSACGDIPIVSTSGR
jgi:hypothetical protein